MRRFPCHDGGVSVRETESGDGGEETVLIPILDKLSRICYNVRENAYVEKILEEYMHGKNTTFWSMAQKER